MGAYECWCRQKQKLRQSIQDAADQGGAAYAVRHTLAQVEQNTMAEQTDDLLRQQTGILFCCCKTSVNLLDVSVSTKVWVPQGRQKNKNPVQTLLWLAAGLLQGFAGLYCYMNGLWLAWVLIGVSLLIGAAALLQGAKQRKKEAPASQFKVTLLPDEEKLFQAIDEQMQAIDRYMNDFTYLNEQNVSNQKIPDGKMISQIADMLEALYEYDDETREEAEAAANRMLDGMGLDAVHYGENNKHLFTTLPSKDMTKTIIPALVAQEDHRLLYRGLAAVKIHGLDED